MPEYRGNLGNLLQHWVFCEILDAARTSNNAAHLALVDAHSMAPLADQRSQRSKKDPTSKLFDAVRKHLRYGESLYERTWYSLSPNGDSYPNSASFLTAIWRGPYTLLLCEINPSIIPLLEGWIRSKPRCIGAEVAGDWRKRFIQGLDLTGDIVVISFDPYMFDCHGPGRSPEPSRMYPCDLRILEKAIKPITKGIIVQLSTYSANNNNPQQIVTEVVDACLKTTGLETACLVKADGNMMSIVLVRDIAWTGALCSLETRFRSWLEDIKNKVGAKVHM